jgi:hypothetical protein
MTLSEAGYGKPVLGGAPASRTATMTRFHALPRMERRRWWVELVECYEVKLCARWIGDWRGGGSTTRPGKHSVDGISASARAGKEERRERTRENERAATASTERERQRARVGATARHVSHAARGSCGWLATAGF